MRKALVLMLSTMAVALVGCVTINVYFPQAAAEKAADQFIGSVLNATSPAKSDATKGSETQEKTQDQGGQPPSASVLDLLIPAAYAQTPNLRIHTPAIDAIHGRMQQRFRTELAPLFDSGAIGFTADGMIAVRDASKVPLAKRAKVNTTVAAENRDRKALYREIANANGHPEWEADIRKTFARLWIEKAHAGWYYRTASGTWKRK